MTTREQIAQALGEYEEDHPVDAWTVNGMSVWPIVRIRTGLLLLQRRTDGARPPLNERVRSRLRAAVRIARVMTAPGPKAAPVVLLGRSARSLRFAGATHNPIVDPIADLLAGRGVLSRIWETGPPAARRLHAPFAIDAWLERAWGFRRLAGVPPPDIEPDWFRPYQDWAWARLSIRLPPWRDWAITFRHLSWMAGAMERLLAGTRLLLVDCWYSREGWAAIHAARRLGILTVDIQHGLQGPGHFAYAQWRRRPIGGGYTTMPAAWWVWGGDDAENLEKANAFPIAQSGIQTGGHPWLNRWRGVEGWELGEKTVMEARRLRAGASRALLVTLQRDVPFIDVLEPLLRQAPADWAWWVRLHPAMRGAEREVTQLLASLNAPGRVDVADATRLPLYALMKAADAHLTWWSTCAHEALAFGLPTVLLHENGADAFSHHVEQDTMRYARSPEAILRAIDELAARGRAIFEQAAAPHFAPSVAAGRALDDLLGRAGILR